VILVDIRAEVCDQRCQPAGITLADGANAPFAPAPIELTEEQCRLLRSVGDVEMDEIHRIGGSLHTEPDEPSRAECDAERSIQAGRENDPLDFLGYIVELQRHHICRHLLTVDFSAQLVAQMDRSIERNRMVVEDQIVVGADSTVGSQQQDAHVRLRRLAVVVAGFQTTVTNRVQRQDRAVLRLRPSRAEAVVAPIGPS
jgi:hypothetical protein